MKSFTATDPQSHNSENTYFTPKFIIDALGPFDLDVCTTIKRPFDTAKDHICVEQRNSLKEDWSGFVWMNPPYGKEINPFIEKFKSHGNGIALVFARMGTEWMQDWVKNGLSIFFLRNRIRFIDKLGIRTKSNAGCDSCLLYCGVEARTRIEGSELVGVFK